MPSEGELLERAIGLALENAAAGQHPFGALVVRDGETLASGVNRTLRDADPTAHAEIEAIRAAARRHGSKALAGTTVVSSCEPCPMCLAAAALAGVSRIVYAAPKEVASEAGFELPPPAAEMHTLWRSAGSASVEHVPMPGAEEPFARFAATGAAEFATSPVRELRVAMTVEDFDRALRFYRDVLGLPVLEAWDDPTGSGAILGAGEATLELLSVDQAELIDRIEVGQRVAGPIRLALQVDDSERAAAELVAGGAEALAPVVMTPWGDRNARVRAPDGMQLTLFTVLEES
jgi:guanine deaminase